MKSCSSGLRSRSLVLKSPAMMMNDDGASDAMKADRSFHTLGRIESCCSPECGIYTPTKCKGCVLLFTVICTIRSEMNVIDLMNCTKYGCTTSPTPEPLIVSCPLV